MSEESSWFVGIDWGVTEHQVCVLNARGEVQGARTVWHDASAVQGLVPAAGPDGRGGGGHRRGARAPPRRVGRYADRIRLRRVRAQPEAARSVS